jgi:hypothetical protein
MTATLTACDGVLRRRAVHADGTGGRAREAEKHVDRRRLPGAVGAEEGDDLAGFDLKGQVVDGRDWPEPLGQIAEVDCEHVVSWREGRVYRRTALGNGLFQPSQLSVFRERVVLIAVEPALAGLGGGSDGMAARAGVLARVLVRRAITASVAPPPDRCGDAPSWTDLDALLALMMRGLANGLDRRDVNARPLDI